VLLNVIELSPVAKVVAANRFSYELLVL